MNRRMLLQTLSVLSASCAWTLMPTSPRANGLRAEGLPREESLLLSLTESREKCAEMLALSESLRNSRSTFLVNGLQQLTRLIEEARSRVTDQRPGGPAFWQSCGDAFFRTAELLTADCNQHHFPNADSRVAEETFRRTADLLAVETIRTARLDAE
jgi:hypothetical protein